DARQWSVPAAGPGPPRSDGHICRESVFGLNRRAWHSWYRSGAFQPALRCLRLGIERGDVRSLIRNFVRIDTEQLGNTLETLGDLTRDCGACGQHFTNRLECCVAFTCIIRQ